MINAVFNYNIIKKLNNRRLFNSVRLHARPVLVIFFLFFEKKPKKGMKTGGTEQKHDQLVYKLIILFFSLAKNQLPRLKKKRFPSVRAFMKDQYWSLALKGGGE